MCCKSARHRLTTAPSNSIQTTDGCGVGQLLCFTCMQVLLTADTGIAYLTHDDRPNISSASSWHGAKRHLRRCTMNKIVYKIFGAMSEDLYIEISAHFGIESVENLVANRRYRFINRYGDWRNRQLFMSNVSLIGSFVWVYFLSIAFCFISVC